MKEDSELTRLFKISGEDEISWPFLREYQVKMDEYLQTNRLTTEQEIRYMLVGMFPLYRAKNLGTEDFSTNLQVLSAQGTFSKGIQQATFFNQKAGFEIASSLHYYSLIKKKQGRKISADYLFRFVLENKPEE